MSKLPNNFVAIDTEGTGLYPWYGAEMFAASAVFPSGRILFWRDEYSGLKELLEDESLEKVFHNAKHDIRTFEAAGFRVRGKVHDTMALGHLMDGRDARGGLSLDAMSKKYLPSKYRKTVEELEEWFKEKKIPKDKIGQHFRDLPHDLLKKRNVGDSTLTLLLFRRLFPYVSSSYAWLYDQEMRLVWAVKAMEDRGIKISWEELEKQKAFLSDVYEDASLTCEGLVGKEMNWNSYTGQIALLDSCGLVDRLEKKTKTGRYSLTKDIIRNLHHPVSSLLLRMKTAAKLRGTFIEQIERFAVGDIVHASFNQFGTVSGRFSCSKPGLHSIPREGGQLTADEEAEDLDDIPLAPHIKKIFVPREGMRFIDSDKKQGEVCMLIHYGQDKVGKEILDNDRDLHFEICTEMFGSAQEKLKQRAKQVVFGWQFGMGLGALAIRLNSTKEEARSYFRLLEKTLPSIGPLKKKWFGQVYDDGFVTTDHGRRHYLSGAEAYIAVNRMCQGSLGDEVKGNMVMLYEEWEPEHEGAHQLLQVHDSDLAEAPIENRKAVAHMHHIMNRSAIKWWVPMRSETKVSSTSWAEGEKIKDWTKWEEK